MVIRDQRCYPLMNKNRLLNSHAAIPSKAKRSPKNIKWLLELELLGSQDFLVYEAPGSLSNIPHFQLQSEYAAQGGMQDSLVALGSSFGIWISNVNDIETKANRTFDNRKILISKWNEHFYYSMNHYRSEARWCSFRFVKERSETKIFIQEFCFSEAKRWQIVLTSKTSKKKSSS